MNTNQYTQKTLEALQAAQQLAVEYQHNAMEPEHLLHALATQEQGLIPQLLQKLNVDPGSFAAAVAEKLSALPRVSGSGRDPDKVYISQATDKVLSAAAREAKAMKDEYVSVEHLLLALGTRDFFELCHKVQVLPHRHFRVEGRLLRQIAHAGLGLVGLLRQRVPRHRYLPAGSREIPGEDIHNGRLARAVGPEQTVDLAVFHRERDIVHRQMTAVFFGEMGYFDHRITLLISASFALLLVYSRI